MIKVNVTLSCTERSEIQFCKTIREIIKEQMEYLEVERNENFSDIPETESEYHIKFNYCDDKGVK